MNYFTWLCYIVVLMDEICRWNEAMWLITDFLPYMKYFVISIGCDTI